MTEALWAAGRASGVVAISLFTASVVLGILTRSGRPLPGIPRFSIVLIHRNVALLGATFVALHVGSLLLDPFAHLTLADVLVPFLGAVSPFWQGLGTVALDLVIAVLVTSLLRRRVGLRVFRTVHWLAYALWPVALLHAVGNGTDGTSRWFLLLAGASVTAVVGAAVWRISAGFSEPAASRRNR